MRGIKTILTELDINNIIKLYQRGQSQASIAKSFKIDKGNLRTLLKDNNAIIDKSILREKRYCKLDQSFFERIDSEEKAYWLGFLFADGNVVLQPSPALQLCLSTADEEHFRKFISMIKSEYKVSIHNYKRPVIQTRISNKKIVDDLIKLGCVPQKTFNLTFPTLPEELIRHFIRGYFDGDGCIYNGKKASAIIFLGTENMLTEIKSKLPIGIESSIRKVKNIYSYRIHLNESRLKAITKYLYEDATVYLNRKKAKFKLQY